MPGKKRKEKEQKLFQKHLSQIFTIIVLKFLDLLASNQDQYIFTSLVTSVNTCNLSLWLQKQIQTTKNVVKGSVKSNHLF